jgi:phage terminase Nu1 subunit (DNA packaging protein)
MKRTKKVVEEFRCTATELAEMFDLSVGRISQLTSQGVLERGQDNHYDLQMAVVSYGRFILCPRLYD